MLNECAAERWGQDSEETDRESGEEKQENTDADSIPGPTGHGNEN